jgi:hypothetical protein
MPFGFGGGRREQDNKDSQIIKMPLTDRDDLEEISKYLKC